MRDSLQQGTSFLVAKVEACLAEVEDLLSYSNDILCTGVWGGLKRMCVCVCGRMWVEEKDVGWGMICKGVVVMHCLLHTSCVVCT